MSEQGNGPPLLRPIPRRPFDLSLTVPTPPDGDASAAAASADPPPSAGNSQAELNLESLNSRLLAPSRRYGLDPPTGSETITRAQSIVNLTGSTLLGIYASTTGSRGRGYGDLDEPGTPWGTGAETPAWRHVAEDEGVSSPVEIKRRQSVRRRSSGRPPQRPLAPRPASALYLGARGLLLFSLGILYGALVAKFQDGQNFSELGLGRLLSLTASDWNYTIFWGLSGLLLGGLMPWFDTVWEDTFRPEDADEVVVESPVEPNAPSAGTDWTLVFRGIGAFVGIVFAIRKLPWASTLQVSMALALVNPFLWYLIDRSVPGLVLSAMMSLTGSAVLLGLMPDMVPTPSHRSSFPSSYGVNSTSTPPPASSSSSSSAALLGGLATQETLDRGMWMLSILFCCCICFGNIGRRLALNQSSASKGRWAEYKEN